MPWRTAHGHCYECGACSGSGGLRVFFSLKDKLRRACFGVQIRDIAKTAAVTLDSSLRLRVVTQLQHKDVPLYLAAIKSFARQAPVAHVNVLDDGSLTHGDYSLLAAHVPGLVIEPIDEFRDPLFPHGGTWERLMAIASLSRDDYVIQLDADTLTLGPIPEVVAAVATGRSFTIGTWDGQEIESIGERVEHAKIVKGSGVRHVQVEAEASLDGLRDAGRLYYVRGCSGFAGFAPSFERMELMRDVSPQMERLLGPTWRQWGSEQVMSNLLVANAPSALVLPHPAYCDCTKIRSDVTRFVHFIGSCRFSDGVYARMINELGL